MQTEATPRTEDRKAFANQLAEVRALDVKGKYKKQRNEMEVEYQFILLRSLSLFHKEMLRSKLPGRLHAIKEKLCATAGSLIYHTNLPFTSWNWNIKICRHCHNNSLKPMPSSNELCCENCGLLEPLDGVSFDYKEIYKAGDYKVGKERRSTRRYNFRHYLEKHVKLIAETGHTLSSETAVKANVFFEVIEQHLPKRISMPFVAYKILEQIVQSGEEHYVLNYFWLQVPQSFVTIHKEKCFDSSMLCELRPNCLQTRKEGLQALADPSVCKGPYACAWQTQGRCCPHNVCIVDRRGSAPHSSPNDNALGWNGTHTSSETDEVRLQPPAPRLDRTRGQARNRESRRECLQGGFADPWPWIYQGRAFVQLVMLTL